QKLTVDISRDAITRSFAIFDPLAIARYTTTRTKSPSASQLVGAATLNQLSQPLSMQYTQMLQTGTQYNVIFGTTKTSNNSTFSIYNPQLASNLNFNISQPLLR